MRQTLTMSHRAAVIAVFLLARSGGDLALGRPSTSHRGQITRAMKREALGEDQ